MRKKLLSNDIKRFEKNVDKIIEYYNIPYNVHYKELKKVLTAWYIDSVVDECVKDTSETYSGTKEIDDSIEFRDTN